MTESIKKFTHPEMVEFTNLRSPKSKDIKVLVETANANGYGGVCVNPGCLGVAKKYKADTVKLVTVFGFPPIYSYPYFKDKRNYSRSLLLCLGDYNRYEVDNIQDCIQEGIVDELDLVFPIRWFMLDKKIRIVKLLSAVKKKFPGKLKVICELGTIFNDETVLTEILQILNDSGVDFFKTNTGLISQHFSISLIPALKTLLSAMDKSGINLPIKASGGIRTAVQAEELAALGIKRIGTSSII